MVPAQQASISAVSNEVALTLEPAGQDGACVEMASGMRGVIATPDPQAEIVHRPQTACGLLQLVGLYPRSGDRYLEPHNRGLGCGYTERLSDWRTSCEPGLLGEPIGEGSPPPLLVHADKGNALRAASPGQIPQPHTGQTQVRKRTPVQRR